MARILLTFNIKIWNGLFYIYFLFFNVVYLFLNSRCNPSVPRSSFKLYPTWMSFPTFVAFIFTVIYAFQNAFWETKIWIVKLLGSVTHPFLLLNLRLFWITQRNLDFFLLDWKYGEVCCEHYHLTNSDHHKLRPRLYRRRDNSIEGAEKHRNET